VKSGDNMVTLQELIAYLDELLEPKQFNDYCPNGLQIAGKGIVKNLVVAVSASQSVIDEAIRLNADAILVHHGYFWRGEDPRLIGIKQQRIRKLLQHDISLITYHLPLDAHPVYGNNVQLAKRLEIDIEHSYEIDKIPNILWVGSLQQATNGNELVKRIAESLQREPLHIAGSDKLINRIGWCTGAAQGFIEHAAAHGVDAYITGEVSESTFHFAQEASIHFYAAGHHATERYGVQALGEHIAHYFSINQQYVEIHNPI
jgi:dinuclear metal center YbgI/SA1388 family protein